MIFQNPLAWPPGWKRTPMALRTDGQFRSTFQQCVKGLSNDFRLMGITDAVISVDAPIRRDGMIYSEAIADKLIQPGVAVYFELVTEPMAMARDAHTTILANLMSIAHTISHMRGLERHGGAAMMQRAFTGFIALPPPDHWTKILGVKPTATSDEINAAFRKLAATAHPDQPGGSANAMARLNHARDNALKGTV